MHDLQQHEHYDPEADAEPFDEAVRHPSSRRMLALIVALLLFGISVLAATFSLLKRPPTPSLTRPLPEPVPTQGAIRR